MGALVGATVFFVLLVVFFNRTLLRIGRSAGMRIPGAVSANGVIVGVVSRPTPARWYPSQMSTLSPLQLPQVRFIDLDGREWTFTADFGTSVRPKTGQAVQVLYDPADPSRAQISPESLPRMGGCGRVAMWVILGVITLVGLAGLTISWLFSTHLR